jgi:hypothetical protein
MACCSGIEKQQTAIVSFFTPGINAFIYKSLLSLEFMPSEYTNGCSLVLQVGRLQMHVAMILALGHDLLGEQLLLPLQSRVLSYCSCG